MLHCAECKINLTTIECASYKGTLYCRPCYEQKKVAVPVYLCCRCMRPVRTVEGKAVWFQGRPWCADCKAKEQGTAAKLPHCAHCSVLLEPYGADSWIYGDKRYCQSCYELRQPQGMKVPLQDLGNHVPMPTTAASTEQSFAGGASSTRKPRYALIPHDAILRLIAVMEKGIERKGDGAWNALSNNQGCLLDEQFIISRIEHMIDHAYRLLRRIKNKDWAGLDETDDAAAIMWAGTFFCEVTRAMQEKEKQDAEAGRIAAGSSTMRP